MATFVVGDIHGKYKKLRQLLKLIEFDPAKDVLWSTGDLVNRGKKSLEVMQFCHSLGNSFLSVLGNHDLFLLALYHGYQSNRKIPKCLTRILECPEVDTLMTWLSAFPFMHYDQQHHTILVHAGISPLSSLTDNITANNKLQHFFQSAEHKASLKEFLCHHMMGNKPRYIEDAQNDYDYYRHFINAYTRMRYCNLAAAPRYGYKGKPDKAPANRLPWFALKQHQILTSKEPVFQILFGHWATLAGQNIASTQVHHLDNACAWGGSLKAMCLDGCSERNYHINQYFSISCA